MSSPLNIPKIPIFVGVVYFVIWNIIIAMTLQADSCGIYWQSPNHLNPIEWLIALFYLIGLILLFCIYFFEERRVSYLVFLFALFVLFMDQIDWGRVLVSSTIREPETPGNFLTPRTLFLPLEVITYLLGPFWLRRHAPEIFFWLALIPLLIREELASLVNKHILLIDYCFGALPQINELLTASTLAYFAYLLGVGIWVRKEQFS